MLKMQKKTDTGAGAGNGFRNGMHVYGWGIRFEAGGRRGGSKIVGVKIVVVGVFVLVLELLVARATVRQSQPTRRTKACGRASVRAEDLRLQGQRARQDGPAHAVDAHTADEPGGTRPRGLARPLGGRRGRLRRRGRGRRGPADGGLRPGMCILFLK